MQIKHFLAKETIDNNDIEALREWLKSGPRLTKGSLTLEFEDKWAKYIGTKYSVFCNSGSSANLLMVYAALASGKLRNNKIVVPSVGWVTTVAPAMQFGMQPIMVGADKNTFGIDLDQLEQVCIKEQPAVVIFVQVLGVPHYKQRLLELKKKYGFVLLEDACAALGARYSDGTMVGQVGDMSSFSFYFGHQLSTIEGGMVNTDSKEIYDLLIMLRSHGWGKDLDQEAYDKLISDNGVDDFHKPFTFFVPGFNVRATDLQAFIGIRQVEKAEWVSERRNRNHVRYANNLKGVVEFQNWDDNMPVSISFGALADSTEHRKQIVKRLVENGVETRIFSAGNLGRHPFWKNVYGEFNDPMSNIIHERGFFVPNDPTLTDEEVDFISSLVRG
jgi:CDP-6-deoxy-D-xylo-4-hexulose-3-dehydrase